MFTNLKNAISEDIKQNGQQQITGDMLQAHLISIINTLGKNATFAGVATPSTEPVAQEGLAFYLAGQKGYYAFLGGATIEDGLYVFSNASGLWQGEKVLDTTAIEAAISSALDAATQAVSAASLAETKGNTAEAQGNAAELKGNEAATLTAQLVDAGTFANNAGDYANQEGDAAKNKGLTAQAQGNEAERQGNIAEAKGDAVDGRLSSIEQDNTALNQGLNSLDSSLKNDTEKSAAEALSSLAARVASLEASLANTLKGKLEVEEEFNVWGKTNLILEGEGAPAFAPDFTGQRYIDITNKVAYTAFGTSNAGDWK